LYWNSYLGVFFFLVYSHTQQQQQQQQKNIALVPNFWGRLWILNKLVRFDHMDFFSSILFYQKSYFLFLIDISFFKFTNAIFGLPLPFFILST